MIINWRGKEFGNKIQGDLNKNLAKAGIYFVSALRKLVNRSQPYKKYGIYFHGLSPSLPGEPPKKLSGQLQRSITWATKPNVLLVGSALGYAGDLQTGTSKMEPRPWLSIGFANEKDKLFNIIVGR